MWRYILKRILIFIPTLVIITLLGFALMAASPGDPLDMVMSAGENDVESKNNPYIIQKKKMLRHELGLDLPLFYLSISSAAIPEGIQAFEDAQRRAAIHRWCFESGRGKDILEIHRMIDVVFEEINTVQPDSIHPCPELPDIRKSLFNLRYSIDSKNALDITAVFEAYARLPYLNPSLQSGLQSIRLKIQEVSEQENSWKKWIPVIAWNPSNQYHRWLFGDGNMFSGSNSQFSRGIIRGDFGKSYTTKQAVNKGLWGKIGWSVLFTLLSVVLGYLVSIPLGVWAAQKRDSWFDRISGFVLYILYSLPNFFVATLLLMAFSNPDMYNWFPSSGIKPVTGYPNDAGFFEKFQLTLPYLILPLIAYAYSSFAFLSRTMRVSLLDNLGQDYIRTARAKGLSERVTVWKHALRNSLLPIITVFAHIFPAAVGGSIILETIFTIPGIGLETYQAVFAKNYPVIIAVLTITGVLTMFGYLVSDILYALADPRISYAGKKK